MIRNDLRSKRKTRVVGTGAMSDPYNPFEKELKITRGALKLIDEFGFGIAIATKSDLISRDIDIIQRIQKHSPVLCKITITTCDDNLSKKIAPNVSLPIQRVEVIKRLSEEGIYCGVLLMPVLPFITDTKENSLGNVKILG